jgi:hypothetical protein
MAAGLKPFTPINCSRKRSPVVTMWRLARWYSQRVARLCGIGEEM